MSNNDVTITHCTCLSLESSKVVYFINAVDYKETILLLLVCSTIQSDLHCIMSLWPIYY